MSAYDPTKDPRLDPRVVPFLQLMEGMGGNLGGDIADRESYVAEANTPEALAASEAFAGMDDLAAVPAEGLRSEVLEFTSSPDGNTIKMNYIRPDMDAVLPCVYYIHGGGMMMGSAFYGHYKTWGRLLARQGFAVLMVDFRNCLTPSSAPEVVPFPGGLNDCVSGFHWAREHAAALKLDGDRILIAGESGGGNLAIATTMKLLQDGHGDALHGLYALCPYIAGRWPQAQYPSSSENDGIFITVGNNRGAMAYGIEALEAGNPLAWPGLATEEDVAAFPPTMVIVNECDPLRDEGIAFYRLLLRAGVKAQCRQVMGTAHGGDLMVSLHADISRTTARDLAGWHEECGLGR